MLVRHVRFSTLGGFAKGRFLVLHLNSGVLVVWALSSYPSILHCFLKIRQAFPCSSSQYRGFFICPLKKWTFSTLNRCAPSFRTTPVFLPPLKPTSFLYKSNRCSRGRQDAIDFVTIALPSLRSLRHLHRRVSSLCYVTRFADENNSSPSAHLYCSSSAALIGSPPCGSNYVCESADSVYMMTENSRYILFQTSQTKNGR